MDTNVVVNFLMTFLVEKVFILIPVLWVIGLLLKDVAKKLPNDFIPLILTIIALVCTFLIMGFSMDAFIQAILVTGVAVYGHEFGKSAITLITNYKNKKE